MKTKKIIGLCILILVLLALKINGLETPKGIDGIIYELDGITEITQEIPIIIQNQNTQEQIHTTTGKGSIGRYSATINWPSGTEINITAYNPDNKAERLINLTGIIHDFNINLNMTMQNHPPNITSIPQTSITQLKTYQYQITTTDWNQDTIMHYLDQAPANMNINQSSGLITWTPNTTQLGDFQIKIMVSDGQLNTTQNYTIRVNNQNLAPIITSTPTTTATTNQEYTYEIIAEDKDRNIFSYNLVQKPEGMTINSNTIRWTPTQAGTYEIKISVIDMEQQQDNQTYNITVISPTSSTGSTSTAQSENGNGIIETQTTEQKQEIKNNIQVKIDSKENIKIIIKENPTIKKEQIQQKTIYKYIEINLLDENGKEIHNKKGKITFKVEKEWLEKRKIQPEEITLERYNGNWQQIPTKQTGETKEFYTYESEAPGFSLFAITTKTPKINSYEMPQIIEIKQPYIITGTITENYKNQNIYFRIKNTNIIHFPQYQKIGKKTFYQVSFLTHPGVIIEIMQNGNPIAELTLNKNIQTHNINLQRNINQTEIYKYILVMYMGILLMLHLWLET